MNNRFIQRVQAAQEKTLKLKAFCPFRANHFFGESYEHDTLHGVACDQPAMESFDFYGCANYFG
jgi:hypothetical protein